VRILSLLTRLCGGLSAILILFTLGFTAYAITLRYVLDAPLKWSDELTGYLLVAIVMLGAAEAYRQGDHISIDILSSRARPGLARCLRAWADLSVLAFAAILGWSAWDSIAFAYDFGSYSAGYLEVAMWIPQLPLLAGALLLGLTALARLARGPSKGPTGKGPS